MYFSALKTVPSTLLLKWMNWPVKPVIGNNIRRGFQSHRKYEELEIPKYIYFWNQKPAKQSMLYTAIPFGALLHHRLKQNQFFPFSKFYCLLLAYPLAVSPIHLKQTDFSTCCLPEAFLPSIQLRNPSQCSKAHLACAFCRGSSSGGS